MVYVDGVLGKNLSENFIWYRNSNDWGYGLPEIEDNELVLTQDLNLVSGYKNTQTLSSYLNLPEGIGLFETFSFFFDGKINEDYEMIDIIFKGLINKSDYCFCLLINSTFCWFIIKDDKIKKLGSIQYSHILNKYNVGKFMKRLRFVIASSGINIDYVRFLIWDEDLVVSTFPNYIPSYTRLVDFFNNIKGLSGLGIQNVMQLLSSHWQEKITVSADNFVDCLKEGAEKLGIKAVEGVLQSNNVFYKDYSECMSTLIHRKKCSYGIILDCEGHNNGHVTDGCRVIGGIIYCRYKNMLLNIDSFTCDEILLIDTLKRVIINYNELTDKYINTGTIHVFVYGTSDEVMFKASVGNFASSSKEERYLLNKFIFCDTKIFIDDYIKKAEIKVEGKRKLDNVAKALGVIVVKPLHNPLNDARTLFNVLAKTIQSYNIELL